MGGLAIDLAVPLMSFCTVLIEALNIREIPRTETPSQISLEIIGLVPLRHALLR
jgi:hypothetical protein